MKERTKSLAWSPYPLLDETGAHININFFITKDYSSDLAKNDNSDKIMEAINRLREPIRKMSHENQAKTMKYIQNLTKLASMYESIF